MSLNQAASHKQSTSPTGGNSTSGHASKTEGVKLPADSNAATKMAGGSAVNSIKPTPRIITPNVKVAVPLVPLAKRKVPVTMPKVATPKVAEPKSRAPDQDIGATSANGDPFKKGASTSEDLAKLSGDASTFKPKPAPIAFLNHDSTVDEQPLIVSSTPVNDVKPDKGKAKAVQEPIGTRGANFSPSRHSYFSTDMGPDVPFQGGHYVKIQAVTKYEMKTTYKTLVDQFDWSSKIRGQFAPTPNDGSTVFDVYLCFDDLGDAETAFVDMEIVNSNWSMQSRYINQTEYASGKREADRAENQESTAFYDGQIVFVVAYEGLSTDYAAEGIYAKIQDLATTYGPVLTFAELKAEQGMFQFRVEYYSISVAKDVIKTVNKVTPVTFDNWVVISKELQSAASREGITGQHSSSMQNGVGVNGTPQKDANGSHVTHISPTGRTAWYVDDSGNSIPVGPPTKLPKVAPTLADATAMPLHRASAPDARTPAHFDVDSSPRSSSWNGVHHAEDVPLGVGHRLKQSNGANTVLIDRIRLGIEVRTTLMLRNIPNRMDVHRVKKILDSCSFGRFDFSYLRIDFENNCNMGYAFVNFLDPADVIRFVETWVGKFWAPDIDGRARRGPRIADVWWAQCQGLDCLIEKFRNSAVMKENKDYIPKLWYSEDNAPRPALIGQEAPFPGPNNMTKHNRSLASAGQVGLYAPGNRRRTNGDPYRRSQYDRGTTAQMQEDAFFHQVSPMQNGYAYGHGHGNNNYVLAGGPVRMAQQPIYAPTAYGPPNTANGCGYGYANPYVNNAAMPQGPGYGYSNGYGAIGDPHGGGFGTEVGNPAAYFQGSPRFQPRRAAPVPPRVAPRRQGLPYIGEHINGVQIKRSPRPTNLPGVAEVNEEATNGHRSNYNGRY